MPGLRDSLHGPSVGHTSLSCFYGRISISLLGVGLFHAGILSVLFVWKRNRL